MENINIQSVKQRFGIIGNSPLLNRAIETACQVAPVDISVLIQGESGVGKEVFPKIIHNFSARKFKPYIAVNCGAIPEGTIDSELFGHEKGSFTGATEARKGYFEAADGGTIFLDEVAELPLQTQVRLLRVLETGEFIKVGSSKVMKTNVRVVAATNDDFNESIKKGKFRQDLFYRLSTVPIYIPPLRERKEDIYMLFRKFSTDIAESNRMPIITLTPEARTMMENYRWEGNVRQLKNIAEQISIIESERIITPQILKHYLPENNISLPVPIHNSATINDNTSFSEREIMYKILFDMKKDISELRQTLNNIISKQQPANDVIQPVTKNLQKIDDDSMFINDLFSKQYDKIPIEVKNEPETVENEPVVYDEDKFQHAEVEEIVEPVTLVQSEINAITKVLAKYKGNRREAAKELGISERTLYRKIKEYHLD